MTPIRVLLVEDSPTDVLMTRTAMEQGKLHVELDIVEDGVEAVDFLRRAGRFSEAQRPDLILLDLNLPRMDGREVLAEIKTDPDLRVIPVCVLTSSKAEEDVVRSYGLHANCYIVKPVNFDSFNAVVRSIESFWFSVVKLPRPSPNQE
jgi:two-component system, chemotaxis family, response regulator Rcp1